MKVEDKELKEFWEWCGFEYVFGELIQTGKYTEQNYYYKAPNGRKYDKIPLLTLDNLFENAVTKLWNLNDKRIDVDGLNVWWNENGDKKWHWCILYFPKTGNKVTDNYCQSVEGIDEDKAQALYKAIREVMK